MPKEIIGYIYVDNLLPNLNEKVQDCIANKIIELVKKDYPNMNIDIDVIIIRDRPSYIAIIDENNYYKDIFNTYYKKVVIDLETENISNVNI